MPSSIFSSKSTVVLLLVLLELTVDRERLRSQRKQCGPGSQVHSQPVAFFVSPQSLWECPPFQPTAPKSQSTKLLWPWPLQKCGPTLCLFNRRNLRLRRKAKLFQNHRHLTIDPMRKADAGNYQFQSLTHQFCGKCVPSRWMWDMRDPPPLFCIIKLWTIFVPF